MLRWLFSVLFLLNLRRSSCPNLPAYIRTKYGLQTLRSYRHLETSQRRYLKAQLDLDFLLYCNLNNIIPNFIKFKVYRASLYHTEFYRDSTQRLLNIEITHKEKLISKHKKKSESLSNAIKSTISHIDFLYIKTVLSKKH